MGGGWGGRRNNVFTLLKRLFVYIYIFFFWYSVVTGTNMGSVQCKDGYCIAQRWVVYSTKMCSMHNVQYKDE